MNIPDIFDRVVALHIGPSARAPDRTGLLRVEACLLVSDVVEERFSAIVRPSCECGSAVDELPGTVADVATEPVAKDQALAALREFIPSGSLCIAHNSGSIRGFLDDGLGESFQHAIVDTKGLAEICYPDLPSHSLPALHESRRYQGTSECDVMVELWRDIVTECMGLPDPVLLAIADLLAGTGDHPLRNLFARIRAIRGLESPANFVSGLRDLIPEGKISKAAQPAAEGGCGPIEETYVTDMLGPTGGFAAALKGYEFREGQLVMAEAVVRAFNESKHLMIEAGTGIGKSLAYLVPAVEWSKQNSVPVIVSTNTKNLQSQLFQKDLPLISDVLGKSFKSAIIKGRMNYLCLRKMFYVLQHADDELDRHQRLQMVNIVAWMAKSDSGDLSENAGWARARTLGMGSLLTSSGEECMGAGCKYRKLCFLKKARVNSLTADLIVANHALVFAELGIESPALPPYQHIVIDEAHNLEEAATRHFSVEVSQVAIRSVLRRLRRPGRRGRGLVRSILRQMESGASLGDPSLKQRAVTRCKDVKAQVELISDTVDTFFHELKKVLKTAKDNIRISADLRDDKLWPPVMDAKRLLVSGLARIEHEAERLAGDLREMDDGSLPFNGGYMKELEGVVDRVKELIRDIEFVLAADEEGHVYWIERAPPRAGYCRAWAAPVSVAAMLAEQLYAEKKSVILSSATLSVRDSFAFLKSRIGMDLVESSRLIEKNAGTPFDYKSQCAVMVPMFLPEPGQQGANYEIELAELLADVFRLTKGRGMTLFTSYEMLKRTAEPLELALAPDGIEILVQGASRSRENITTVFKRNLESVLMGTHSFWEGVDMMGETLSCLVVARLPFAVFTDPVVEARCEMIGAAGSDPFMGYSLPSAVIRLRQGFGRLIRHRTDRGVVIVADRRIISRRYGSWFRRSLPSSTTSYSDKDEMLDAVRQFMEQEY